MLVLFGASEAGCFREVAALFSDHIDRFHCTVYGLGITAYKYEVLRKRDKMKGPF